MAFSEPLRWPARAHASATHRLAELRALVSRRRRARAARHQRDPARYLTHLAAIGRKVSIELNEWAGAGPRRREPRKRACCHDLKDFPRRPSSFAPTWWISPLAGNWITARGAGPRGVDAAVRQIVNRVVPPASDVGPGARKHARPHVSRLRPSTPCASGVDLPTTCRP